MTNPFAMSRIFHRIGHVTNTMAWKVLPTPGGLALVTIIGRKSGKQRQRAMRVVRDGNQVYAVALLGEKSDWLRNLRANPAVRLKLGATTYIATGRILAHPDERKRAAAIYRPIAGWYDYADYANFVWSLPTRGRVLRAHDQWFEQGTPVVFEIESRQ